MYICITISVQSVSIGNATRREGIKCMRLIMSLLSRAVKTGPDGGMPRISYRNFVKTNIFEDDG